MHVILSDRRESKDLRTDLTMAVPVMRRSFGALRLLRMTKQEIYTQKSPRFFGNGGFYDQTMIYSPSPVTVRVLEK